MNAVNHVVKPVLHLNGTSSKELLHGLDIATSAVFDAITAVQSAAPNQRDYYPLGDLAWISAREQHVARVECLTRVSQELDEIRAAVYDAAEARENQRSRRQA